MGLVVSMMGNSNRGPLDHSGLSDLLDRVAFPTPSLERLFRYRIEKIERDEIDAMVSAEWARRVRREIAEELEALAQRPVSR